MAGSVRAGWVAITAGYALLALAACSTTWRATGFKAPQESHRVLIIQPDTSVGTLTTSGRFEPNAEWTETARNNVTASLKTRLEARSNGAALIKTSTELGIDPGVIESLNSEHRTLSVNIHKESVKGEYYKKDPTTRKVATKPVFTFNEQILAFGQPNGFDYAVLTYARESVATGGRTALVGASFVGCTLIDALLPAPLCIPPSGGQQTAYVSLVDLDNGQVVWHNFRNSSFGDLRDAKNADEMIANLLEVL
jgi:hypothetical protein